MTLRSELLRSTNRIQEKSLFLNLSGIRISTRSVRRSLDKYGKQANLAQRIYPNILRHSFAVHSLRKGKNLKEIQIDLGHASISTTKIYSPFLGVSGEKSA
jgi:site-specific recombinase XerD